MLSYPLLTLPIPLFLSLPLTFGWRVVIKFPSWFADCLASCLWLWWCLMFANLSWREISPMRFDRLGRSWNSKQTEILYSATWLFSLIVHYCGNSIWYHVFEGLLESTLNISMVSIRDKTSDSCLKQRKKNTESISVNCEWGKWQWIPYKDSPL